MIRSLRLGPTLLLTALLTLIASCGTPDADAPTATSSTAPAADAATAAADLQAPVFRADGQPGLVPERIVIEFPEPVFDEVHTGMTSPGTTLEIEPRVDGSFSVLTPTSMVFLPSAGLAPDTLYKLELHTVEIPAVDNEDGGGDGELLYPPRPGAWTGEIQTPPFEFLRFSLRELEGRNRADQAKVEFVFTGAVDPQQVRERARLTVVDDATGESWTPQPRFRRENSDMPHVVVAELSNRGIKPGTRLEFTLAEGVPSARDAAKPAPAASGAIHFGREPRLRIVDVYRAESASGFYIQVICDDPSLAEESGFWDDVQSRWYEVSPRCLPAEASAAEAISFEPKVEHTVAPSRGGFRVFGAFARGAYRMRIAAGLTSADGAVLPDVYETRFEIPARKPQARFVSQGRYLPRDAWKLVPIRHLNVRSAKLEVRRVPPENLVFWMSNDQSERADERVADLLLSRDLPLSGPPDQETTSYVDLGSMVPAQTRGLLELHLGASGAEGDRVRVLLTNLHLVAKRQADGTVDAWALEMRSLDAVRDVELQLVRRSGFVMASCLTTPDGHCRLAPRAGGPDDSPPFAVLARRAGDLTYLKFSDLEAEVDEERVAGEPYRGGRPYRAALWAERGVYRPGESAHLAAILRQEGDTAPPTGMPLRAELLDPRGKTIEQRTLTTNGGGWTTFDFAFPDFASTGRYTARLQVAEAVVGEHVFQVEEFVPERMRVQAAATEQSLLAGTDAEVDIHARYLFGGVPSEHRVELTCELEPGDFTPEENANFHYGVWRPGTGPELGLTLGTASGVLDADGAARLTCPGYRQGYLGPARLVARAAVFEAGGGRTSVGRATTAVHPERFYIGLQSDTTKAEAGRALRVDGVVVDWNGAPSTAAAEVELEWVRLEQEWGWFWDGASGRWRSRHQLRPATVEKRTAKVRDGRFSLSFTPASDAAGFLVRASAHNARTDLELEGRGDWYYRAPQEDSDRTPGPGRATWLALSNLPSPGSAAEPIARVGKEMTLRFEAPYRGRVLWTVETDELVESAWQEVDKAGPVRFSFTPKKFHPNVYVTAFLVKDPGLEGGGAFLPERAFGVRAVRLEPTELTHPLRLAAPAEVRSSSRLSVDLDLGKLDEPTWATVAAVDEGILSLTGYNSPDPFKDLFTQRALGVKTFETIGWTLLIPPGGPAGSAGGKDGGLGRVRPVEPVALWSGLVEVPTSGKVTVDFDVPSYRGELRVMAVSGGAKKLGRAETSVVVRDPLIVQSTVPRFLLGDDTAQVPVMVTNVSGKAREVEVRLTAAALDVGGAVGADGPGKASGSPVQIVGKDHITLDLADGADATAVFTVRAARPVGAAEIRVAVRSGDVESVESVRLPILPKGSTERRTQRIELAQGDQDLRPYLEGWLPLSERSTFWVTSQPYGEAFSHLKYLVRYPYGCIEQTTSAARPLLYLGELLSASDPQLVAEAGLDAMVQAGIDRVLSMQTADGGFSYWPGGGTPAYWGTAYATHFLLDAKARDYRVPEEALAEALRWIERQISHFYEAGGRSDDWYSKDAEPYLHYVLALAGKPRKARAEHLLKGIGDFPVGEAREHALLLRAALHKAGDHRFEARLKSPDLSPIQDARDNGWTFYSDRRRRALELAVLVDLFGRDAALEPLADLVAASLRGRPSDQFTTQELVWAVTGLGRFSAASAESFAPPILHADGRDLAPRGAKAGSSERTWDVVRASEYDNLRLTVPEKGNGKLYLILTSEGVRETPDMRYGGEGLSLARRYYDAAGEPLDPSAEMPLGELIYVELEAANPGSERIANLALVDRVPAGWEIENPRLGRGGLPEWADPDKLWQADHLDLRDDRLEVFGHLEAGERKTVLYAVRATTAGRFTRPSASLEAMYDPRLRARERGGSARVAGPW